MSCRRLKIFSAGVFFALPFWSLAAPPKNQQCYYLSVSHGQKLVGYTKVVVHQSATAQTVDVRLYIRMPVAFLSVVAKRHTRFTFSPAGVMTRFYCLSQIPVPGYDFKRQATRQGRELLVKTRRGDQVTIKKYIIGRDFDYMTGDRVMGFISPKNPRRRVRFFNLEVGRIDTETYTLKKHYWSNVSGQKTLLYDFTITSAHMKQSIVMMARLNIPIRFDIQLPLIGALKVRYLESPQRILASFPNPVPVPPRKRNGCRPKTSKGGD